MGTLRTTAISARCEDCREQWEVRGADDDLDLSALPYVSFGAGEERCCCGGRLLLSFVPVAGVKR